MTNTDYNKHLINALSNLSGRDSLYFQVEGQTIKVAIQSGPVKDNGRNGCDVTDIIRYTIGLYKSFNNAVPCRENSLTITRLEEALHWQESRTRERVSRSVEGANKI